MAEDDRPDGPPLVGLRLGLMFFLQWATWGVWVPVLGRILKAPVAEGGLGFSELQIGLLMGLPATLGSGHWPRHSLPANWPTDGSRPRKHSA